MKYTNKCRFACAVFASSMISPGYAEHRDILSEQDYYMDLPVVISGSRLATPLNESPLPITVIDKEMIEASGMTEVHDLFRLVPGFIAGDYRGHTPLVSFLFLNDSLSRRLQVMINNRSVYTPSLGGPIWRTLPLHLDDVERIEIIRGPNSASYGSNSFLGVVNIITKDPVLQQGWSYSTAGGNHQTRSHALQYGGGQGALNYRIRLWHHENDGYSNRHDGSKTGYLDSHMDYRPTLRDTISIAFGGSQANLNQDEPQRNITIPHDKSMGFNYQMLQWHRVGKNGSEYTLKAFHNFDSQKERYQTVSALNLDQNFHSHRNDLEFQWSKHANRSNLTAGGSVREDVSSSSRYLRKFTPVQIYTQRAFAHGAWHFDDRVQITGGVTLENSNVNAFQTSPILALNFHYLPHHTARLTLTSASRSPIAFEESPDLIIEDPSSGAIDQIYHRRFDVDAETIKTLDLGFIGTVGNGFQYELSLAKHRLEDIIVADVGPLLPEHNSPDNQDLSALFFMNYEKAEFQTLQTSLKYQSMHWLWYGSYAWAKGESTTALKADERIDNATPEHLTSMLVSWKANRQFRISMGYYHRENTRGVDLTTQIPSSDRIDLSIFYKRKKRDYQTEFGLTARNLTKSSEPLYIFNNDQRQILATLKIHLN